MQRLIEGDFDVLDETFVNRMDAESEEKYDPEEEGEDLGSEEGVLAPGEGPESAESGWEEFNTDTDIKKLMDGMQGVRTNWPQEFGAGLEDERDALVEDDMDTDELLRTAHILAGDIKNTGDEAEYARLSGALQAIADEISNRAGAEGEQGHPFESPSKAFDAYKRHMKAKYGTDRIETKMTPDETRKYEELYEKYMKDNENP